MAEKLLNAHNVAELLGISKSKAYNIIRALNNLLIKDGTPKDCIVSGKISEKYLKEKLKI